ncbi:MlaD family protein [Nocardia bovistercoris]|uniref:MCE family protein n=1 Tax=Nocardia bovistercoris TaxID=2785916 RepID=A0A931IHH3_9NOCA|nr:MCE family protein [Nocardia bovistercoris]MBH0779718.1 MCE family protein [Nocardia bovistercoris]
MSIAFEAEDRNLTDVGLFLRGLAVLAVVTATVAAMIARSEGAFTPTVEVTAMLVDVGDGLPKRSDVKYRGVLVGSVAEVAAATAGQPNTVRIDLVPEHAAGIPATVTARVVPSNVFAVPSVQLIDNGPGPALAAGASIPEDHSRASVQLQTSLTALSRIVAAVGRPGADPTVGVLETVERATSGRGADALRAASQLDRIVRAYNDEARSGAEFSLLSSLAEAVTGLQQSAPDLLAALHSAIGPMRTVAEQRSHLSELLTGGTATTGTVGTAMTNRTDTIVDLNSRLGPVLAVLAAGSDDFVQMTTSQTRVAHVFTSEFWNAENQSGTAKVIAELTPHKQYTRTDCPRYGDLAGASCDNGPAAGPPVIGALDPSPGTDEQRRRFAEALGIPPEIAGVAQLLGLSPQAPPGTDPPGIGTPTPQPGGPR